MKSGQQTILYALVILMISFIIMMGAFGISKVLKDNTAKNVGEKIINNIFAQIEVTLVEFKFYNNVTNMTIVSRTIEIPKRLGDQEYLIFAKGNDTVGIQTISHPALLKEVNMTTIWNVNYAGTVHSICGQIVIEYVNGSQKINLKCNRDQSLERPNYNYTTDVPAETLCADGLDNDGDGNTDCLDSDCFTDPNCFV